jgi:hypothetical protein
VVIPGTQIKLMRTAVWENRAESCTIFGYCSTFRAVDRRVASTAGQPSTPGNTRMLYKQIDAGKHPNAGQTKVFTDIIQTH